MALVQRTFLCEYPVAVQAVDPAVGKQEIVQVQIGLADPRRMMAGDQFHHPAHQSQTLCRVRLLQTAGQRLRMLYPGEHDDRPGLAVPARVEYLRRRDTGPVECCQAIRFALEMHLRAAPDPGRP